MFSCFAEIPLSPICQDLTHLDSSDVGSHPAMPMAPFLVLAWKPLAWELGTLFMGNNKGWVQLVMLQDPVNNILLLNEGLFFRKVPHISMN
jgi:hypothetical protein